MYNPVKKIIENYIDRLQLLKPKDKIVVGFSGGADSTALLHILHNLGYTCIAAHCNFHLRGEESDRDEAFVTDFAASLNLPLYKQHFDTKRIAKERGISIEMAARELRYHWFAELKEKHRADAIAVAHHKDDSIETVLLNLIRGTGIKGLTGIQPKTGDLIRPLLCVSKKDILQYVSSDNLPFVTDSSNKQDQWIRNKIRLQLIPLMETINPSVRKSIIQTMENMTEAFKIYEKEIDNTIQVIFNREKGVISIPLLKTSSSPESLLFEILKDYGFGKEVIKEMHTAIDSQPGKMFYAENYYVVKDRNEFLLSPVIQEDNKSYFVYEDDRIIETPVRLTISFLSDNTKDLIEKKTNVACLDHDKLQFPLILRKWKKGDKFIPLGMKNFQKLSDFFTNLKFSKIQKENTWILISGEKIVWIVNHRIDDRFKADIHTKKRYILKLL